MSSQTVDNIYQTVKRRIITAEYEPGCVLSESVLAEEFRVSRTPVREALHSLQQEGWLRALQGIGSQVAPLDFTELTAFFEIKKSLEALAARMACKNMTEKAFAQLTELARGLEKTETQSDITAADQAFHQKVWETAGNPLLMNYLTRLHERLQRYWQALPEMQPELNTFIETFRRLLNAFESRCEEDAALQAVLHVESYIKQIRDRLF